MFGKLMVMIAGAIVWSLAFAGESDSHVGGVGSIAPSTVLVRAQRLTGLDENDRRHLLFSSEHGLLLPVTDLTSIDKYLGSNRQPIPEGTYHSLQLELGNDVFIYGPAGQPAVSQLSLDGRSEMVSISGVIRVAGTEITPLALAVESWRPKETPEESGHQ